jgi:membrane-associated phospholipid phosphatase
MKNNTMNKSVFLLLALLTTQAGVCRAWDSAGAYGNELLSRTGSVLVSPLHMDAEDAYWTAGIAAGGLLVYSADGQIRHMMGRNHSSLNDSLAKDFEKFGNGGYEMAVLGVYGGAAYLTGKKDGPHVALLAVESFAAANAVGTIAKCVAGRARPYAGDGKDHFTPFTTKTADTSFPSGHTTSAFAVASVLASGGGSPVVGVAAYALATGTALQRMYADKHWASDVFTGAALGTAVGRWITAQDRAAAKKGNGTSAMILPVYAKGYGGATAVLNF